MDAQGNSVDLSNSSTWAWADQRSLCRPPAEAPKELAEEVFKGLETDSRTSNKKGTSGGQGMYAQGSAVSQARASSSSA